MQIECNCNPTFAFSMNGTYIILVKNMVCNRCIAAVQDILHSEGINYDSVRLGEIELKAPLTQTQKETLQERLRHTGFALIDSRTTGLVEKIKQLVIRRARNQADENDAKLKLSGYISGCLHHEYSYLSNLFSSIEGRTIEHYFIDQRIEYVKELLVYDELTLSEIALQLEYSSTAHLSAQFKKVTGLTPSHYKKIGAEKRKALDHV